MEYVLQVIGRHIKSVLSSFQKDTNPEASVEDKSTVFIQSILESFGDELQISHVNASANPAADIACAAFSLPSCYCIRLSCMGGETVYGAIGAKRRRKEGYYHFPGNYSQAAHLIDLIRFLSMAFVFSGIHQIQICIKRTHIFPERRRIYWWNAYNRANRCLSNTFSKLTQTEGRIAFI